MIKTSPKLLFQSMMATNALFALAALLGAFNSIPELLDSIMLGSVTLSFIGFAVLFFMTLSDAKLGYKISGTIYSVSSVILGITLFSMSLALVPLDSDPNAPVQSFKFILLFSAVLVLLTFFQTFFMTATRAGKLTFSVLYLFALGSLIWLSALGGNIIWLLGPITLIATAIAALRIKPSSEKASGRRKR